jgi:hypothetical protein
MNGDTYKVKMVEELLELGIPTSLSLEDKRKVTETIWELADSIPDKIMYDSLMITKAKASKSYMNIPQFLGYWKVVAKNKVEQTTNQ